MYSLGKNLGKGNVTLKEEKDSLRRPDYARAFEEGVELLDKKCKRQTNHDILMMVMIITFFFLFFR